FFQAEDGIRAFHVTGVQTCALPILMRSMPSLASRDEPLVAIEGNVPPPYDLPSGCRFRTRCPHARRICAEREPPANRAGPTHEVSCWTGTDAYAGSGTESR